jgi:hypothetical protein
MINVMFSLSIFQEQTKLDASKQPTSPEECDDLSPMPQTTAPPVRRRGGISAEPVSEEDATSYVKKVSNRCIMPVIHHDQFDKSNLGI